MKLRFVVGVMLIALSVAGSVKAAEVSPAMPVKAPRPTPADDWMGADLWQRDKLSGDWGGARTQASERGQNEDKYHDADDNE